MYTSIRICRSIHLYITMLTIYMHLLSSRRRPWPATLCPKVAFDAASRVRFTGTCTRKGRERGGFLRVEISSLLDVLR